MPKEWSYAMPRKSPFPIVLTDEQRAVLESKVRKYPSSYIDVVRANPGRCRWILTVRLCSMPPRVWRIRRLLRGSTPPSRSSLSGVNGSSSTAWKGCRRLLGEAGSLASLPEVVVEVKAFACELPWASGLPLSRLSMADIRYEVIGRGRA